ncbi:MAG: alginate export family protein [Bacteroidales bacterium]|nr:alginate export family protein [Bacteroidales bacterium]
MKRICTLFILLAASVCAWAQENNLSIDADFLTRGEIRSGGLPVSEEEGAVNKDFASFILERTLIGLNYEKKNFSSKVMAQHSGTWGSSEGGSFNVYEAWVRMSTDKGLFVKIGRQNLSYDDQRIFGADDWAMTARSHDVLKAGYEGHNQKIHLFAAFNQNTANINGGTYYSGGVQPYKAMEALWYHYDIPRTKIGVSLLFMNAAMQGGEKDEPNEKTYQQQLAGGFLSYRPKKLNAEAAYYHQMGKSEGGLPIDAWMMSYKATYDPSAQFSFTAGYDYLSGDADFATPYQGQIGMIQHKTIKGFSSLYGSHHKFYGAMDFFYVTTYVSGFTPGLQNLYAGMSFKPVEKVSMDAMYHYLATATKLRNAEKPLGHEIEISGSYKFMGNAKLSIGYSYMRGTETMVILKKTSDNRQLRWGWIMLTVSPKFFSGKW